MKIRIHIEHLVLNTGTLAPVDGHRLQWAIAVALESHLSPESPARTATGPRQPAPSTRPVARHDRTEQLGTQIARAVYSSLGTSFGGNHGGELKEGPQR